MNKIIFISIVTCLNLCGFDFFWDLGVSISNVPLHQTNGDITISTFHRVEGMKKYYARDYNSAIFHFSQLDELNKKNILYEYLDCYYSMNAFDEAMHIFESYSNFDLSDNVIYLKAKTCLKLNLLNDAFYNLNYIIEFFPDSEYLGIVQFEIEKINLLNNE
jgi:tetratricopeptide (TPR) repeat protein